MDNKKEYILCAAWKRKFPRSIISNTPPYKPENNDILLIEIGYRHHDIYERFGDELSIEANAMGFYTSCGRFVSRTEAMEIACKCGQFPENKAKWTQEELDSPILPLKSVSIGDWKPLASEDLYKCNIDGWSE